MKITGYEFDYYRSYVDVQDASMAIVRIYFNEYTGTIIKRPKRSPLSLIGLMVDHKGLYIGITADNTEIIAHNHKDFGGALLCTYSSFANGRKVSIDNKQCTNHPLRRVQIALIKIIEGKRYDLLDYSCQTYVNQACTNTSKNDDTPKVLFGLGVAAVSILAIAASSNNNRR